MFERIVEGKGITRKCGGHDGAVEEGGRKRGRGEKGGGAD